MSRFKKIALVTGALLLMAAPAAHTQTVTEADLIRYFPDDVADHWAANTMLDLVHAEIINGYIDATNPGRVTVRPENPITRAEFVTLLVKALDLKAFGPGQTFTDVRTDAWFYPYIQTVSSLGVTSGIGEGQFAPDQNIERDEIAAMIQRAFDKTIQWTGTPKTFNDVPNNWATASINKVSAVGIVNGYAGGDFRPNASATRAEAMQMLHNALLTENTALPDDATLTALTVGEVNDNIAALKTADFDLYYKNNARYDSGYEKMMSNAVVDVFKQAHDQGMKIDVSLTGTPAASVEKKANRFAVLRRTGSGLSYTLTTTDGAKHSDTREGEEFVYLHKTTDGTWKIYSSHPVTGQTTS